MQEPDRLLTVYDISKLMKVNRNTARELLNKYNVPMLTFGRTHKVRVSTFNKFLEKLESEAQGKS